MLNKYGQGGGLNAGLSLWLPLDDLGAGAVNTVPANSSGSGTATFTRATTATTFDATGTAPISVASGVARSYYSPVSHAYLGYLAEEQRTNLLLNSTINGANLATQSVTVTAQAYTLSFYGTGTVTLSGTAVATDVGSGAYPTRSTFTFTPTAGTLTLTVTGTVQYANLEAGSFATSFIPTAGAAVTRNADVLNYPSTGNMSGTTGTAYAETGLVLRAAAPGGAILTGGDNNGRLLWAPTNTTTTIQSSSNTATASLTSFSAGSNKVASSWTGAGLSVVANGGTVGTSANSVALTATLIEVGTRGGGNDQPDGCIKNVRIWTRALADSQLVSMTS